MDRTFSIHDFSGQFRQYGNGGLVRLVWAADPEHRALVGRHLTQNNVWNFDYGRLSFDRFRRY
jgi:hypothetical protein